MNIYHDGQMIRVKNNGLRSTDREFGMDSRMYDMQGKTYKFNERYKGDRGIQIKGYWFSYDDIEPVSMKTEKDEQVVHFDVEQLSI